MNAGVVEAVVDVGDGVVVVGLVMSGVGSRCAGGWVSRTT
jgi:hypothetical protein